MMYHNISYGDCATIGNYTLRRGYMAYQPPSDKWHCFENIRPSHAKDSSVAHSPYIISHNYSIVGQSIAFISNFGGIFTSVVRTPVNMAPWVEYISYGPPYHTIYNTYRIVVIHTIK